MLIILIFYTDYQPPGWPHFHADLVLSTVRVGEVDNNGIRCDVFYPNMTVTDDAAYQRMRYFEETAGGPENQGGLPSPIECHDETGMIKVLAGPLLVLCLIGGPCVFACFRCFGCTSRCTQKVHPAA